MLVSVIAWKGDLKRHSGELRPTSVRIISGCPRRKVVASRTALSPPGSSNKSVSFFIQRELLASVSRPSSPWNFRSSSGCASSSMFSWRTLATSIISATAPRGLRWRSGALYRLHLYCTVSPGRKLCSSTRSIGTAVLQRRGCA